MDKRKMGVEQEVYLAPETEKIENAKEIAETSKNAEKHIFSISYEIADKEAFLSEIKRLECEMIEETDSKNCVIVRISKAQLAAIKTLNCIEKVEMADERSTITTENVSETMTYNELEETEFTEHVLLAAAEEETISTMCYGGDFDNDCDNSNTMQTANYLPLATWVNGSVSCPGGEVWYSFTPSTTAYYTVHTDGSLDTVGYLYDSNGNYIDDDDDAGSALNFKMVQRLTAYKTYYIKVMAYGSNTGSFSIAVVGTVFVESVTINQPLVVLNKGESTTLSAEVLPSYATNKMLSWTSSNSAVASIDSVMGYVTAKKAGETTIKATAQDGSGEYGACIVRVVNAIPVQSITIDCNTHTMNVGEITHLNYEIYPADATNQSVIWCSTDTSVAEIDPNTGCIIAKASGETTITVTTNDGSFVDSCLLTVVIDTVTIQKDGAFNKVVFNKSGKVWRCINHDMIYNDDNSNNSILIQRSNHNFFTYYDEDDMLNSNTTPKEYTNDEIKLLYAIDPYGVADYVQRYAATKEGLSGTLQEKDRVFRLLFNREPKYFARTIDGTTWYKTTDKSNLSAVQSESESVFGMHPIWDSYTIIQIIEAAATMVDIALTIVCTAPKVVAYLKAHKNVKTIAKIFSFTASSIGSGFISASADEFIEKAFEETSLSWAYDIVSLYSSLNELVSDFDIGENYYQQVFENCANNLHYNIYVELQNGQKYQLTEINGLLTNN